MMDLLKLIVGIRLMASCSGSGVEPDEPHLQPGKYGGTPLPGIGMFQCGFCHPKLSSALSPV